jgi:phospholipid-binding lipoprotein MlaA
MNRQYCQTFRVVFCFALLTIFSGCANTGNISGGDPFESFNRGAFKFNKAMDKKLFNPIAEVYEAILPKVVNEGVTNIFSNMNDISVIANDILQFKFEQAFSDFFRFVVNSSIGLLGFFDVSSDMGLEKHREDFGQSLAKWGFDSGPFFIIPLLGPTTLRGSMSLIVDGVLLSPTTYIRDTGYSSGLMALQYMDFKADLLSTGELLGIAAVDEYGFLKSVFLQYRDNLVYDRSEDDIPEVESTDFDSYDE